MDYVYDNSSQLIKYRRITDSSNEEYTYTYDKSGNRTRLVKTGVEHPETIEYTYNSSNQLVCEESTVSGKTEYAYDANGNLIRKSKGSDTYTYEYTVDLKLKAVRKGGSLLMAASYDGDGNRIFTATKTESIHEYPPEEEINIPDITGKANDGNGNEDVIQPGNNDTADNTGRDDNTTGNTAGNTSTGVSADTTVSNDSATGMFWYGFGLGIIEFVSGVNAGLAVGAADRFNSKWDCLAGRTESENLSKADNEYPETQGIIIPDVQDTDNGDGTYTKTEYATAYYVNNINTENAQVLMTYESPASDIPSAVYTYGNERISVKDTVSKDTVSKDTVRSYYLYDGRGSVAQLADNTGVTRTFTYDPYGEITCGAKEYESLYGYNAEEYNTVTGLTYLRYRYLDNETGRFTQEDNYLGSIINAVSLNRYTYANNNPVMYADPSGHLGILAAIGIGAAVGAAVGAVSSVVSQVSRGEKVSLKKVAKSAAVGAMGAAVGVAVAVSLPVATSFGGVVAAGALTTVAAGMAARGLDSLITSAEEDRNIPETVSQFGKDVLNPEDVAKDAIIGGATAGITYGVNTTLSKALNKVNQIKKNLCEKTPNIEKKTVTTENSTAKVNVDTAKGSGIEGGSKTINGLNIIDGKVDGKIPLAEYEKYRVDSVHNVDSNIMTLGKYESTIRADGTKDFSVPGPGAYTVKAGDTTYFSLGTEWDKITDTYGLDAAGKNMFDYFNKPALDDAVSAGKEIRFSHNPEAYGECALKWEWDYLQEKHGYFALEKRGDFWYATK